MKIQLLHIFDDGREVWVEHLDDRYDDEHDGLWIRVGNGRWGDADDGTVYGKSCAVGIDLESARDEALEVDEVFPDATRNRAQMCVLRKGGRLSGFDWLDGTAWVYVDDWDHGGDWLRVGSHPRDQAQAFRWLFMGRLD